MATWLEDHRLRSELGYNAKDIGNMDVEERIFHLGIFYASDMKRILEDKKRKKEQKRLQAKTRGMKRRVRH